VCASYYKRDADPCISHDLQVRGQDALSKFVEIVGIPYVVVVDGAQEQVGRNTEFSRTCKFYKVQQHQTEPYTPKQNRAEATIGEVKKRWRNKMHSKNVPKQLWDYGLVWVSEITNQTAHGPDARTPIEEVTGNTPDISEWLDFDFMTGVGTGKVQCMN